MTRNSKKDILTIFKGGAGEIIDNTSPKQSFIQNIKQKMSDFLKSEFYFFMKYYFYFIIIFAICFYLLLYIKNTTKNEMIVTESKIFFYILIALLFIVINDILETPLESLNKFLLIIIFSLIVIYIISNLLEHFYKDDTFKHKLLLVFISTLVVFILTIIIIYFVFERNNKDVAKKLYNGFNFGINKNFGFLVFTFIYLFIYKILHSYLDWNSNMSDILCPSILGFMIVIYIFFIIIYVSYKMKIIDRVSLLNTFIALSAIFVFLMLNCLYIFMSSLGTICTEGATQETVNTQEIVSILILVSIFIILWLDDSRNWHQTGSILFIFATIVALYTMFYYSQNHPGVGLLSFWLFIEWLIIIFYRKENSKNSMHFSFMTT